MFIKITCLVVILCFVGCETTRIKYVENDKLPGDKIFTIVAVYLNDGTELNLKGTEPAFKTRYKGKENVIVYFTEQYDEKFIELKDIRVIKIEIVESDVLLSVIIIVSSVALLFLILLLIFGLPSERFNITG